MSIRETTENAISNQLDEIEAKINDTLQDVRSSLEFLEEEKYEDAVFVLENAEITLSALARELY